MSRLTIKSMPQQSNIAKEITTVTISSQIQISDREFGLFQKLIYDKAGISLSDAKRSLVVSRLNKRLRELELDTFEQYFNIVVSKNSERELQYTINMLTTNETYFFREQQHFDFLKQKILPRIKSTSGFSVWSAASSTGEEAYTTAMVIADSLAISGNWKIIGTDINHDVLEQARCGLYPITEKGKIDKHYLAKYCLKGVRAQEGMLLIDKKLKNHVSFEALNLVGTWQRDLSDFDLVFLRNVMIYFDTETKKRLINRIADRLKIGGHLFIGHSETINRLTDRFKIVQPSICQRIK